MGVEEPFAHAGFADGIPYGRTQGRAPADEGAPGIDAGSVDEIERARAPLRHWPDALARLYREEVVERLYREEYFLFLLGLLVGISTVVIDLLVHPAMAREGIVLRVLAIAPVTFIGLVAGARGWTQTLAFCVGAAPIAFTAVIVHLVAQWLGQGRGFPVG